MDAIATREVEGGELRDGAALLAASLRFADCDAVPAWLMQTAVELGGLALGAFAARRLVGFSFALPWGTDALFSCGLAVDPACRGVGIGRRLKLAQRDRALADGRARIRWTADPLAAPALALYLTGLGARLTEYRPELYAATRPEPVPPDDVVIDWPLEPEANEPSGSAERVEVPSDRRMLDDVALRSWRLRVREGMCAALDAGAVGTGVRVDRAAGRAWVQFEQRG